MTEQMWWPWFCDVWWEIGVAYTLTFSGDWMLRVLAARMGADSAERHKVDQVLDKIGDFHRRLWDIETEVVRKAVDIAADWKTVVIVDERLLESPNGAIENPPVLAVLHEEISRRGIVPLKYFSSSIVLKREFDEERILRRQGQIIVTSPTLRLPPTIWTFNVEPTVLRIPLSSP